MVSTHLSLGHGVTVSNQFKSCKQSGNGNAIDLVMSENHTYVKKAYWDCRYVRFQIKRQ